MLHNNKKSVRPYREGVGIVLFHHGLIWRGRRRVEQSWQMPQGGIEQGETPQEASFRELEEETGILPSKITQTGTMKSWLSYDFPPSMGEIFEGRYRGQRLMWFGFVFHGNDADVRLPEGGEFDAWDWRSAETVLTDVVVFRKPMYQKVLEKITP